MMGENQFHYTLITTYSSGRHLCTDPELANSAALALSVPVCVCSCVRCVCMPKWGCVNVCVCIYVGLLLCPSPDS